MHRRITASFEFRSPNWLERRDIWRLHASNGCKLSAEIDWQEIALRYELAGGFIKNAMHSALLNAVSREGPENPVITQQDVEEGCALQMRGSLKMKAFRHRVVPTAGLEQLVLTETVLQQVSKKTLTRICVKDPRLFRPSLLTGRSNPTSILSMREACYPRFLLTRALLMTPSHPAASRGQFRESEGDTDGPVGV